MILVNHWSTLYTIVVSLQSHMYSDHIYVHNAYSCLEVIAILTPSESWMNWEQRSYSFEECH